MNLKCSFGASVEANPRKGIEAENWIPVKGNAMLVITEECSKPEGEPISASARVRSRDDAFFLPLHGFHSIAGNAWCSSIRNSTASFPIELALFGLVEIPGNLEFVFPNRACVDSQGIESLRFFVGKQSRSWQ